MRVYDRLLLDDIKDEIVGLEQRYNYNCNNDPELTTHYDLDFDNIKKLISFLEFSLKGDSYLDF
jgi:hypothetical protein